MFPHINQISRPKEQNSLVQEAGIAIHNTNKDTEDNVT